MLRWREKQYDLRMHLDVFGASSDSQPVICNALTYIARCSLLTLSCSAARPHAGKGAHTLRPSAALR